MDQVLAWALIVLVLMITFCCACGCGQVSHILLLIHAKIYHFAILSFYFGVPNKRVVPKINVIYKIANLTNMLFYVI